MKYHIELKYDLEELFRMEDFIQNCKVLNNDEVKKLLIISTELVDNIVSYSSGHSENVIKVRIYKGMNTSILFVFHSSSFSVFVSKLHKMDVIFDKNINRYRGMGMKMCYNLSESIHYRISNNYNAIRLTV